MEISQEYAVLKRTYPGYTIEPQTSLPSLTWAKARIRDLHGKKDEESERAVLLAGFCARGFAQGGDRGAKRVQKR